MIRLFKVSIPSNVIALVVSEIVLVFSCYLLAAYLTFDVAPDVFLIDDGGLWHISWWWPSSSSASTSTICTRTFACARGFCCCSRSAWCWAWPSYCRRR